MSVHVNTYVLYGAVLPYDLFRDKTDALEPYTDSASDDIHHHDGLCVLIDGMNGRYIAVGYVIAKTEAGAPFDEPVVLRLGLLDALNLRDKIERFLLKFTDIGIADDEIGDYINVGWRVISHYR